jgi:hypothetical protein
LGIVAAPEAMDLADAVADAVATTVAHLTGPVLRNAFDVNFGFSGMAKLAGDLRGVRGQAVWIHRFASDEGLEYVADRLDRCLQHEYTAQDATPLYADFLDEAAQTLGQAGFADAAASFAILDATGRPSAGDSHRRRKAPHTRRHGRAR